MKRAPTTVGTALAVLVTLPLGAQEEPAAQFGEELEVIEVLVDVLATDRRGRLIRGLTAADFVVVEDGEPREVTSATFYTTRYEDLPIPSEEPAAEPPGGLPPSDLPASRYFVLFFHDQTHEASNRAELTTMRLRAARDAEDWIEGTPGPSDWFAVVRYDQSLTVETDFTQDRSRILEAIETATRNQRSDALRPSRRARREALGGPSLTAGLPHYADVSNDIVRIEDAVRVVAEACRDIVGRKNMVLFTLGFGRIESPLGSPDERYYPPMEAALNDSNVAVYPIDLNGSGNLSAQNNFLSQLADETGGIYFATFNRFLDPLNAIARYNTGYYLVSFRSEVPAGERGYRSFEIKAKNKKVRVKARRGYAYGPRDPGQQ